MKDKIKEAHNFAEVAHREQERKFTKRPYVAHLEETAQLVWEATEGKANTDDYIAAILHDVVEDTETTLTEIGQTFGKVVMDLVSELTSDPIEVKNQGKKYYLTKKINTMSSRALTIKLCDRLSNITELDYKNTPDYFVNKYVTETGYLLSNLNRHLNGPQSYLINKIKNTLLYLIVSKDFPCQT